MDLHGKRALVTGASGGIGGAFARQLAARGASLLLTGRNEDKLRSLAAELGAGGAGEVTWIAADLGQPGGCRSLFEQTEAANRPIDILVNNAGVGRFGALVDRPWDDVAAELQLNMLSLTELAQRFGRAMRERGRGYILNVSSFVAYTPVPQFATYGAAKAYVLSLSEALGHELGPAGVQVCCVVPGSARTSWWETAGQKQPAFLIRATMASPDHVARVGLRGLFRGRRNVVVGAANALTLFLLRFLPRSVIVWTAGKFVGGARS
ncbi:MAG: SDR family oxidoreductase [Acidobacteria bacterium]|nr:SDR family oxidoreductase [Acidobacteriota bacterium]